MNNKIFLSFLLIILTASSAKAQLNSSENNSVIREKFDLAKKMYDNAEYTAAIKELTLAIQMFKKADGKDMGVNRIQLHLTRARSYSGLNNHSLALKDMDSAINLVPYGPVENRPLFAKLYLERGDIGMDYETFRDAIHDYTTSINFHHTIADPYLSRGYARVKINALHDALLDFDMAVKLEPSSENHFLRGTVRYFLKMHTETISDMDKILAEVPDHPEALFLKGASLTQLSSRKEGCQLLRKSAELGNEDAKRALIKDCE